MSIEASVNLDTYEPPHREPNFLRSFATLALGTALIAGGMAVNNRIDGKHTGAVAAEDYVEQELGYTPAHHKNTHPHDSDCGADRPPSYDFAVTGPNGDEILVTVCDDSGSGFSLRQS